MKNIRVFLSEKSQFLEVKFSIYLSRCVFVMRDINTCTFVPRSLNVSLDFLHFVLVRFYTDPLQTNVTRDFSIFYLL